MALIGKFDGALTPLLPRCLPPSSTNSPCPRRDEHGVEKITLHLPEDQTKPSSLPQDSKPDRRSPAPRQGTPSGSAAPPKAKAAPSIFHRPTTFTNGSRSTTPFSASRPASPNKPRTPSGSNVAGPSQIDPIPRVYDMTVTNKETKNMFVFGEKERPTQPLPAGGDARSWARRRARQVRLVGRIRHECSLTPSLGAGDDIAAYSSIMRERQRMADAPKRTTKILSVDAGQQNRMASGAINFGSKGGMGGLKDGFAGFVVRFPIRSDFSDLYWKEWGGSTDMCRLRTRSCSAINRRVRAGRKRLGCRRSNYWTCSSTFSKTRTSIGQTGSS